MSRRIALLGASGFVGSHVRLALQDTGADVRPVRAPRLGRDGSRSATDAHQAYLVEHLSDCDVVVNAAGVADAVSSSSDLDGPNHQLPRLLAQVTTQLGLRLVHVSSAAVQGRRATLDSSAEHAPFSAYSASKAAGERAILSQHGEVCVYRPPGVHGPDRAVTRTLVRFARGPWATVASPGQQNSPQALVENVAHAIAFLATTDKQLPRIVHHPSEGLTVSSLLHLLGGRRPRHVPRVMAAATIRGAFWSARAHPGLEGHARRLEVLWNGQEQAPSWLAAAGWQAPHGAEGWAELGRSVAAGLSTERG